MTGNTTALLPNEDETIERSETAVRILLTLLFFIIVRVVEALLAVLIVFELLFALVTRREPSAEVKSFANRALSYAVTVVRYLTYNEHDAPFPLRDFPAELDLTPPTPGPGGEQTGKPV